MSLPVTEDTPPDMLAGSMDLNVVLPDGKTVRMSVQRGTPMMDLLVQVTTAHCLSPGDYSLQAMGDKGVLPFKPNTPIGALDTFTVKIVEKKSNIRGRAPQVPQSFLNSFRLQVHLPRSQLFVLRVTPDVGLSEIMTHICTEKNLNLEKYEFRHPVKSEEVLELDKTLGYYKVQELTLVSKGNRTVTGLMPSAEMINVKSSKHRQNSVCDSSLSSGSFGSRSGSPVPAINVVRTPPQPPIRKKRRPAPKPPSFIDKEKKDRNFSSVLISHSRESSDSSGYHEASVLSESPTHGGPVGRMDGDSPPDTLPRRSQLPSSQSFTNLTSIQPAPKGRLISSVSNTSLNSNGCSRKKRIAPPPPQNHQTTKEEKTKSSTLPISIAEERRNGTSFMTESSFASAKVDAPVDVSNTKVQIPIEITSRVVNETKASKDEVPSTVDVDNRLPPKPKPRTVLQCQLDSAAEKSVEKLITIEPSCRSEVSSRHVKRASPIRRSNLENLSEDVMSEESSGKFSKCNTSTVVEWDHREEEITFGDRLTTNNDNNNNKKTETGKNKLLFRKTDTCEEILAAENSDQTDHDSINWEYQLPPPPTDFRDTNSPSCTEFGTITITPDVFENVDSYRPTQEEKSLSKKSEQIDRSINLKFQVNGFGVENENNYEYNHHIYRSGSEKKLSQTKVEVMNELTNILNENRKQKEKSLSVNNLYINDSIAEEKRSALNYSRSFSTEPVFSLMNGNAEQRYANGLSNNNKKLSISNEIVRDNEITYRNYKNLEKSSSMESIQVSKLDNGVQLIEKSEEIFRKPVAPVQKKLKVARRSASSLGVNTSIQKKRNATGNGQDSWSEDPNLSVLREQFLEFLREKKLMMNAKDLNMKSLDVICNILPEVVKNSNSAEDRVVEEKNEINSHEHAQTQSGLEREDKVKVVDVKVKPPFETPQDESKPTDFLRHEEKVIKEGNKVENPSKITQQQQQQKKQELTKRYSYQGPPSINFGTWGERPKTTRIIIKDEDYVTQENVTEKKSEMIQSAAPKSADTDQKPKEVKKTQIVIKKPGVLSHYEMFSALPRKKEISSLKMMFMEEDEKRRRNLIESKDSSRVPVVCGMELKKEFKEVETPGKTQISPPPTAPQEELNKPRHAVSVYINGCREEEGKDKAVCLKSTPSFMIPKRNPTLMPVVKGFRSLEDSIPKNRVNVVNSAANNQININIAGCSKEGPGDHNQKWCPQPFKLQTIGSVPPPPPPPPNINSIKLKPVSCEYARSKTVSQDPRSQLLDEIRNFGGLKKLNKSTAH